AVDESRWYAEHHWYSDTSHSFHPTSYVAWPGVRPMIHRVRQLIAQPKDGGDEVNIYAARLLTTTLLVILAGVLSDRLLVPSIPLLEGFSFAISIALVLMVLMMAWFLRRGHHLVAAYSTVV